MTRRCGRCARGLRLRASVPHGHWKLTTLVADLRTAGISVPYVFEGAINGQRFRAHVEQMLAPTLAPGDIVLLEPQLRISLEMFAVERDGRLPGSEGVSDEAGENMDHGVHGRPVA